jgi:hypothetical protein
MEVLLSYPRPRVAIVNVERASVHNEIYAQVEVLPVVDVASIVLWNLLAIHKLALGQPAVLNHWLDDRNGVILKVIVDLQDKTIALR